MQPGELRVLHEGPRGRVILADSATYCDARLGAGDVFVGASYCGSTTAAFALRWGVKGLIGHAAGVGKDQAGISGLDYARRHGVPAAAAASASARIGDGESLHAGRIGHVNPLAAALGVREGQPVADAARLLLAAPPGHPVDVSDALTSTLNAVERGAQGVIYEILSLSQVPQPHPRDVFCVGSHAGTVLVHYGLKVRPLGIIANDAGDSMDRSGTAGLGPLDAAGVAVAAVAAASARIGDSASTWHDGVISVCNALARQRGVRPGMSAQEAARRMLGAFRY